MLVEVCGCGMPPHGDQRALATSPNVPARLASPPEATRSLSATRDTVASCPTIASDVPISMYGYVSEIDSSSRMSASHCTWLLES